MNEEGEFELVEFFNRVNSILGAEYDWQDKKGLNIIKVKDMVRWVKCVVC